MPNPLASIWDDEYPTQKPVVKAPVRIKPKPDHSEARALYEAYLVKVAELKRHQDYAIAVAKATDAPDMTPVKPLATMGTGGGALLCDHCKKPIVLEGGAYHNIPVDQAWRLNTHRECKWVSWISGGMVVRIVDNGTLRVYHGYEGNPKHCCTYARVQMDKAEEAWVKDTAVLKKLFAFVEDEFPGADHNRMVSDVFAVMFSFDPGIGINTP